MQEAHLISTLCFPSLQQNFLLHLKRILFLFFCPSGKTPSCFPIPDGLVNHLFFLTCTHCFIYLSVAMLTLCCSVQAFSSCGERGLLSRGGAPASRSSGFSCCGSWALDARASVAAAPRLWRWGPPACSSGARGIFPDQGGDCPLPWQVNSFPSKPPGKPCKSAF